MKTEYIIVGQGIAGSVMALTLHKLGKSVVVIGDETKSSSSRIAAGVYNPFNFRRSTPTWKARELTLSAKYFYEEAERITEEHFHQSRNIVRIFSSTEEQSIWNSYMQGEHEFAERVSAETGFGQVTTPLGYGIVRGGGVVNTHAFLEATKTFFQKRNEFADELFDGAKLEISSEGVLYDQKISAGRIIFCEGHLAAANRFCDPLILAPTKGELLHVSIPGLGLNEVLNGPVYMVPLGSDEYVCGATFRPGKTDEEITADGKQELLEKLKTMTSLPVHVIRQFAGIRPAGRDRKPLVGLHTEYKQIAFFNGAGSKGVLLSPMLAEMLADHMESGAPLLPEVDIARFSRRKLRQ